MVKGCQRHLVSVAASCQYDRERETIRVAGSVWIKAHDHKLLN